jgi:membrane-bound lytic murein transglycosylase MltF
VVRVRVRIIGQLSRGLSRVYPQRQQKAERCDNKNMPLHALVPSFVVHAIIEQESSWNPMALSNKGAAGLMQLMPETTRFYEVRNR